jgi:hypothetical protein
MKLSNGIIGKMITAIVLFAFTSTAFAQKPALQKTFKDKAVKNLICGMENEVPSIVESSLFVTLELKDRFPEENYTKLLDKFNELATNGATLPIRYKAQLTSLYFNYHDLFKNVNVSKEDPDQFYRMITEKIETNTLAAK